MCAAVRFRTPSRRVVRAVVGLWLTLALTAVFGCAFQQRERYHELERDWERAGEESGHEVAPGERPPGDLSLAGTSEGVSDDPFAGVSELERASLVKLVLERNPSLRAARFAWRAALSRHPQVTSLDDPMLGFGVAPRSFDSKVVDDGYRFDLSQRLPFPGKLALRGEAALAEAEAAGQDHAAVRLRLATMASNLFDDYYLARRALEINTEHVALLEEFQRIAAARYEVGEASQQDPIQAEVELTHALHDALLLETRQRVIAEQINVLLHRRADAPLPPPPTRLAQPVSRPRAGDDPQARGLIAEALRERPELLAAEARVRAREAAVASARREYFPDLTLSGAYDRVWQEKDLQPYVGVAINVPLQLGRRRAALSEANAQLQMARSERDALEDEVRFGVESGALWLHEAEHVLDLYRDRLLPAARDRVDAARAGFESGRNSFLVLIDAERNLRDIELGREEALANLGRRRAELERALGIVPGVGW